MQSLNPLRIAILFHSSLFAAGIASRLAEAGFINVTLLNTSQPENVAEIKTHCPEMIIFDSSDKIVTKEVCLLTVLKEIPGLHILQVDYETEEVQIYCSQQKIAHEMDDFISLMQNFTISVDK